MAKKTIVDPQQKNKLELTDIEAQKFDPDLVKEQKQRITPAYIKANDRERLRRGPYSVYFKGKKFYEAKTRREAYDKALEINEKHGFPTMLVEEKFD